MQQRTLIRTTTALLFACVFASPVSIAQANVAAPVITDAVADMNALTFSWTYTGKPDWFTAQYSCDGGVQWTSVDMIPATERAWLIDTTVNADECVVRIAARTDNVNGVFSEPIAATPGSSNAPTNVQIDVASNTISWGNVAAAEVVEYEVQASIDNGVTWTIVGRTAAGLSGLQVPQLEPGTAFRVVAITKDGQRVASDIQRALDVEAADVVRTASIPRSRIFTITGIAILLALAIGQWALVRRRRQQTEAGFEDFDALTRR